jgi:hypothetical protein
MMADPLLLVVEGQDDKHVIWAILERHNFAPEFAIQDEGGYESLHQRHSRRLKPGSDLERIGIVVDADANILARWQSIRSVLDRAGYAGAPDQPDPAGTVIGHDILPRVGVWIMPNNVLPGMLEDYLAFLVPTGDGLLQRVSESLDGIPPEERRFADAHRPKALIHTWLAWQAEPGKPLGQAITARYLDADNPHVAVFLAWLTRLFA